MWKLLLAAGPKLIDFAAKNGSAIGANALGAIGTVVGSSLGSGTEPDQEKLDQLNGIVEREAMKLATAQNIGLDAARKRVHDSMAEQFAAASGTEPSVAKQVIGGLVGGTLGIIGGAKLGGMAAAKYAPKSAPHNAPTTTPQETTNASQVNGVPPKIDKSPLQAQMDEEAHIEQLLGMNRKQARNTPFDELANDPAAEAEAARAAFSAQNPLPIAAMPGMRGYVADPLAAAKDAQLEQQRLRYLMGRGD